MLIAQLAEMHLSFGRMAGLFLTLFVVSKGIPTVPRGSLVLIAAGLSGFGLPSEVIGAGIGLLLAIDPILDMARTGTNMAGNCLAAAVVARWEEQVKA